MCTKSRRWSGDKRFLEIVEIVELVIYVPSLWRNGFTIGDKANNHQGRAPLTQISWVSFVFVPPPLNQHRVL